jgi:hypothetical protein
MLEQNKKVCGVCRCRNGEHCKCSFEMFNDWRMCRSVRHTACISWTQRCRIWLRLACASLRLFHGRALRQQPSGYFLHHHSNSTFLPRSFAWIAEQTAIIWLYSIINCAVCRPGLRVDQQGRCQDVIEYSATWRWCTQGFHTRKNFSENYPQFVHAPSKYSPALLYEYRFEWRQIVAWPALATCLPCGRNCIFINSSGDSSRRRERNHLQKEMNTQ